MYGVFLCWHSDLYRAVLYLIVLSRYSMGYTHIWIWIALDSSHIVHCGLWYIMFPASCFHWCEPYSQDRRRRRLHRVSRRGGGHRMRSHRSGQNAAGVILTVMCFSMMDKWVLTEMILEILWIQYTHFEKLLSGKFLELEIWLECLRCRSTWMSTKHHLFGRMPPSFPMSYCRSKVLCYHFIIFDSLCWSFLGPRLGKFELKFLHGSITRGSPEKGKQSWKRLISAYIRITCLIINPSLLELLDILYLGFINEFNLDYGHCFQAATRQKRSPIRKFPPPPITMCKWKWDNWPTLLGRHWE